MHTRYICNRALCAYINIHCPATDAGALTVFMVWLLAWCQVTCTTK